MPPRKRAKASAASTPLADSQPKTPQESGPGQSQEHVHSDPWADEQETQLFKSMMKWKPTGLHKHFRMISIHNDMRSHGFATEDAPHTRIPGIWRKLDQLYELEALDERENQYAFSEDADPGDPAATAASMPHFELPEDEFGELMWQKRFRGEESPASSPAAVSIEDDRALFHPGVGLLRERPGSARSQKAETPAEATPTPKNTKATRASRANQKGARAAKGNAAASRASKAQSAVSESAEEADDADDDDDNDNNDHESTAESEEDSAPTTRRTNRGRQRNPQNPQVKRTRRRH
ncbi:chromatin modification-related protein EAF7-domain-containing protein [Ampelomyces quisqualis]|uniref:Chromatin modification-related protein EAF7-domain-containing protein n=1 Tax=Ampelomyces quisqualis TaxID=50730 RepID=A0A6A5QES4_AMPQU|nr:chromatin modification-related protein EAF7-domain-containing protein [Ampelomyces quisqualis]